MSKILCYFILFIAFLLSYQKNPIAVLIIVGSVLGLYAFFKIKRRQKSGFLGIKRKGNDDDSQSFNNLMMVFMALQAFGDHKSIDNPSILGKYPEERKNHNADDIEQIKQKVLAMLGN